ncbi:hypothetical protein HAHE_36360 [Haloferula helveola]|uniref:Uncharacterized protein n=1 Tax=Haloferula helveola TaxID=490095 RepID=A0ABN6H8C2_9BACT|nr:hypothetical protein HAHE_36360 [Haloferula helveola]
MKTLSLFLLLAALVTPSIADEKMVIRFDNGDHFQGMLGGIDGESVLWKSNAIFGTQAFSLERVTDISLPPSNELELPEGNHVAVATLTNGDEVRGSLLNLTEKEIVILTSFAGELTFRRDMVAKLDIEDRPELFYVGPTGMDGWVQSDDGGWTYDAGALICEMGSSIGRDIGRHDKIKIAFDIAWKEGARFRLYTHADSDDPDEMQNGFELVCQSQYAYMRKRVTRNNRTESMTIGTTGGVREFQEREKARVEILHDLVNGRVRFILDGRIVADWREPAPIPDKMGGFIHFSADRSNDTRISRIRITSWDGTIEGEWREAPAGFLNIEEEPEDEDPKPEEENPDIVLRNGDRIEGTIAGIKDGKVRLDTSFKEFDIPVSRLRSFPLRTAEEAADPELCWEPIRRNGDVRAWFVDGGRITFQLTGLKDGALVGTSQTFGEAAFELDAFSRLEFNLYPRGYPKAGE